VRIRFGYGLDSRIYGILLVNHTNHSQHDFHFDVNVDTSKLRRPTRGREVLCLLGDCFKIICSDRKRNVL
jgi:hypothetical protein